MQQIHRKTIIDIETGAVVYDDAVQWRGPVVQAGGKAPKAAKVPPPSAEEIEQRQIANLASRQSLYDQGFETYKDDSGALQLRKRELTPQEMEQQQLETDIMARFRKDLNKKPGEVSPEEQSALDTLYGSEQSKMDEELQRFAVESAGSRGLSMGDTPLAREVLLAKQRGQTELGAARASSKLQFAEKERLFNQGLSQWRADLQQQRMSNLMAAGGQAGNTATGFMNARGNLRSGGSAGSAGNAGAIASGIGGVAMGIGAAF